MTNQVYFAGYRYEHFSGWNGVGPGSAAVYGSGEGTGTATGITYMVMNYTTNVLWKDLNLDTKEDICIFWYTFTSGSVSNFNFLDTNNNVLSLTISSNYIHISTGIYNPTTYAISNVVQLQSITVSPVTSRPFTTMTMKYNQTTGLYDYLTIHTTTLNNTTPVKVFDSSITNSVVNVKSIFSTGGLGNSNWFYGVVSNFDMTGGYLDWSSIHSTGSINQWSGNTSPFSTYAVSYSASGGMSSSVNDSSQSYVLTRSLATTSSTYIPLAVIVSGNNISTSNSTISPFMTNGQISYTGTDISTVTSTGNTSTFYFTGNPITNTSWNNSDIINYQFGFTQIS